MTVMTHGRSANPISSADDVQVPPTLEKNMSNSKVQTGLALVTLSLGACAGTGRYVDTPPLTVVGSSVPMQQALQTLFLSGDAGYDIQLCQPDATTKTCTKPDDGISARGVGGVFIPLFMSVSGLEVSQAKPSANGVALAAKVNAQITGIPPVCGTINGEVIGKTDSAKVSFSNFYCNWAGVGNVITNVDLSIDNIDAVNKTFTGYYKITFYGTGNASGSGNYKATIVPSSRATKT